MSAIRCLLAMAVLGFGLPSVARGAEAESTTRSLEMRRALAKESIAILREKDSFAAIEHISGHADPKIATQVFGDLANYFYWKEKDLAASVAMGRAGVQFGLAAGERLKKEDPAESQEIRSVAKALSYDIASFTWPGWGEKEIEIGRGELAAGLDAAKTNLRLALELKKGETPMGRAHWMLGAQLIAHKKYDEARKQFESAVEHFARAKNEGERLLSQGFLALVGILESPDNEAERKALAQTNDALSKLEDGPFFKEQLSTAMTVFTGLQKK